MQPFREATIGELPADSLGALWIETAIFIIADDAAADMPGQSRMADADFGRHWANGNGCHRPIIFVNRTRISSCASELSARIGSCWRRSGALGAFKTWGVGLGGPTSRLKGPAPVTPRNAANLQPAFESQRGNHMLKRSRRADLSRETAAIIEQARELRGELRSRRKQLEAEVEATRELHDKLRRRRGFAWFPA